MAKRNRVCSRCGEALPEGRIFTYCNPCRRAYREATIEKSREYNRQYMYRVQRDKPQLWAKWRQAQRSRSQGQPQAATTSAGA
jgi:hypothetical protein